MSGFFSPTRNKGDPFPPLYSAPQIGIVHNVQSLCSFGHSVTEYLEPHIRALTVRQL